MNIKDNKLLHSYNCCICLEDGTTFTDVHLIKTIMDENINKKFFFNIGIKDKYLSNINNTNKIPKGSKIYLGNDIPIDIETIRKNYVIKRNRDDADYIIFSKPNSKSKFSRIIRYYDKQNILIFNDVYNDDKVDDIINEYNLNNETYIDISYSPLFSCADVKKIFKDYIKDINSGKFVSYKSLDLENGDDLTLDVINLTYMIAKKTPSKDNTDSLILNLKALNNYNWRKYKFTLGILFRCSLGYTVFGNIITRLGSQCKTVYDIITECKKKYSWTEQEDKKLAQEFISSILELNDFPAYVTTSKLIRKINENHIDINDFEKVFDTLMRIKKL